MTNNPAKAATTRPPTSQAMLALEPPMVVPEAKRQACLMLLAEMLKNLIQHERKEATNER